MLRAESWKAGPGQIGPGSLDRLPSIPDDFVFDSGQGMAMAVPALARNDSLGYSQLPLQHVDESGFDSK